MTTTTDGARVAVYTTPETCWRGHAGVLRVSPPINGWQHYCPECQAMVMTHVELERSQAEPLPEGALGKVVAWPLKEPLRIEPWPPGGDR